MLASVALPPGAGAWFFNNASGQPEFTITSFESRGSDRSTLRVAMSSACSKDELLRKTNIYPPVRINWWNSSQPNESTIDINGLFKPGEQYTFSIPDGFVCSGNAYKPTIVTYKVPDLDEHVSFQGEGTLVERDSRQMIHLKLVNVDELKMRITSIPPIMVPLSHAHSKYHTGAVSEIHETVAKSLKEKYARVLPALRTKTDYKEFLGPSADEVSTFLPNIERNVEASYSLPFPSIKQKGVASLMLASFNDAMPKMLRVTDLAISYKIASGSMLIWVTSLGNGHPVQGVRIVGFINGYDKATYLGKTDKDGLLAIEHNMKLGSVSIMNGSTADYLFYAIEVDYLVATLEDDATYMKVEDRGNLNTSWLTSLTGKAKKERLMNGHIFTERGIYRPGEPVHFKGTLREYVGGDVLPPKGVVPNVIITDAKNQKVYEATHELSEFGTFSGTFNTRSFHPLGNYTIKVIFGSDEASTTSRTFQVQEFRPPRHFARVDFKPVTRKDKLVVNRDIDLNILDCEISGGYYAGGPVKDGKVRWKAYYKGSKFSPKGYEDYSFGNYLPSREELLESGESVLDDEGRLKVAIPIGKEVMAGTYGIEVMATVLDFDGRAASETSVYQSKPEYFVGLSSHPEDVRIGEKQLLRAIVVDLNGSKITQGDIEVEIQRSREIYTRKRADNGDAYWTYDTVFMKEFGAPMRINDGEAILDFDLQNYGEYIVKFIYRDGSGRAYSSSTKYKAEYDHSSHGSQTRSEGFERLTLIVDKSRYSAGDAVRVKVLAPRTPSDMLVTVERGRVIEKRVMKFNPADPYLEFKLGPEHAPNVYISVLAIAPREDFPTYTSEFDSTPPAFMLGVLNVEVTNSAESLKVEIDPAQRMLKSEPGGKVKLKLALKDSTGKTVRGEMAVAVVDESVLQMTGFSTPKLEGLLSFNSPLGVFTGDIRMDLLSQTPFKYLTNNPLTGGDGMEKRPEAVTSKVRKDFSPVAFFNPAVRTGANGMAEVEFIVPDTMTTYRVYAVACDAGSGFGSSQRDLLVVKDFYIEPGLPRFFTAGDKFRFNVNAFNKTDAPGTSRFEVGHDSIVELKAQGESFALKAMDNTLMPVEGRAIKPGTSQMSFTGRFRPGLDDRVEMKVPVNSGMLLWNDLLMGAASGMTTINYKFPADTKALKLDSIGPEEFKVELSITGSPFMQMSEGLKYLLKYPYGCVEQTSSGVLPLAALRGLIEKGLVPGIEINETTKFIDSGVRRLLTMQTGTGGFGYWPGDMMPHRWGTIYAMTALSKARLSGVDVPKENMNKAFEYLRNNLKNPSEGDMDFKAFGYYILALNGELDESTFTGAFANPALYSREGAMMVLLASKISGITHGRDLAQDAKNVLASSIDENRSYSFYARYRETAIALMTASSILPDSEEAGRQATKLMGSVNKEGIWTSTSDTGWSLMAMGQHFGNINFGSKMLTISYMQAGWPWTTVAIDPMRITTFPIEAGSFKSNPSIAITTPAGAGVMYKLAVKFPRLDMAQSGYSNGFGVTKKYQNMSGSGPIKVGDIVKVTLKVDVKDWRYHYIVLDDPLPAGMVAINTAIKTEEYMPADSRIRSDDSESEGEVEGDIDYDWYDYWSELDHETGEYRFTPNFFEMRDDRVLVFKNRIWSGKYTYTYYARAICEGSFVVPSTKVQLMYEPDIVGYSPAVTMNIEARR